MDADTVIGMLLARDLEDVDRDVTRAVARQYEIEMALRRSMPPRERMALQLEHVRLRKVVF